MSGTRKSNLLGKITVLVVICCLCLTAQAKYGGGSGTADDPYLILDAKQMNAIGAGSNDWDKHFKLMADIDLGQFTDEEFNIIGTDWDHLFTGVFDGNGHTISNFSYTSTDKGNIGLFGLVSGVNAEIKNLGLIDPKVVAGTGWSIGTLVGWLSDGTISNCYVEGGCVSGYTRVGGLVGYNGKGTITNCYSSAGVSGDWRVGGLVGINYRTITDCYSTGSVLGNEHVGGLVGVNVATITNCYASGTVSGDDNVGGLVGSDYSGNVLSCFWDIQTSGQIWSACGTGKTTDQMQDLNTFLYWGACGNEGVWTIDDGNDYPRLAWQNLPGVFIVTYEPEYGGGSGTEADPYQIRTAEQLKTIGLIPCHWDKHFKLMADIDLSSYTGTSFNLIGTDYDLSFTGVFDGNGHTISNFIYTSTGTNYIGLFGYVYGYNAEIKDLGLIEPNVDAGTGWAVGSLVGYLREGTITNCYAEGGSVSGDRYVGGLVGWNGRYGAIITNCYAAVSVSGAYKVGRLVGSNDYGRITNCYSTGSVSGDKHVGGLVGDNYKGIISNCYATVSVTGDEYVGGLVGYNNRGTVTNCYSIGSVSGAYKVGGLVGSNGYGRITNCYSTGSVSGDEHVGGLVGFNHAIISYCYSIGSVAGNSEVGGLLGVNYNGKVIASFWDIETSGRTDSAAGEGKTTAQMQDPNIYIDWGCGSVWTIDEGKDYPRLWWENAPGELITTPSYGGGSGEPNDPYLIYTAEQLNTIDLIPCDLGKHFKLMTDIDLSEYTGTNFNIIRYFTGVFDGNGHTISNFSYTSTDKGDIGLFSIVSGVNAEIKNLGLINPNVDAGTGWSVGSLVGNLRCGTITNCYVEGGTVSSDDAVGGLVGWNDYSTIITNCCSTAGVSGDFRVGGLAGWNRGTINNCYASGDVSGLNSVGGLTGVNHGPITNCYSSGSVSGEEYVGRLVGWNWSTIIGCYSTGSVSGTDYTGGLVGYGWRGYVSGSYWDIESSGQLTSAGGTGKTKAEMQMASTYIGWWCGSVWTIDEGFDYPRLWWENKPGELITAPSVLYGGGTGEPNDPYLIYTAEQLNTIGLVVCDWDKCFKLMADVDLSVCAGTAFNIIGYWSSSTDNKPFAGVFNGNGHTVSNLACDHYSSRYRGLFGYVNGGEIVNLGLIDPNVAGGRTAGSLVGYMEDGNIVNCYAEGGSADGDGAVGGLVGENQEGTITDCYATVSVEGDNSVVGGLVGHNWWGGTITNCYATGSIYTEENLDPIGGLVGWNSGTITNCYATGSIYAEVSSEPIGGLVGRNSYGTISNCYSTVSVSGDQYVGGLVGYNHLSSILNCYSSGSVSGDQYVGGLVGQNGSEYSQFSIISNCYSTGSVSGTGWEIGGLVGINIGAINNCYATGDVEGDEKVGGLVGQNGSGYSQFSKIYNCYSTGSVIGDEEVGGLVGYNEEGEVTDSFWDIETSGRLYSAGGTGLTTDQMQIPEPFQEAGWDFIYQPDGPHDIWAEPVGGGYPILWWLFSPLPTLPAFSGGTGTTEDPYLISTANDLNQIGHNPRLMSAHFKLVNDIDLTGTDFFLIGSQASPFSCVFNGNGYTISNFTYDANRANLVGLFGYVEGENAGIKKLGLINPNVDAGTGDYVGSLVGRVSGGAITDCYVKEGSVSGHDRVGGLVGENLRCTITNCYSSGSISGYALVGGLVGRNYSTITNCYSTGSVAGDYCVGGLVGFNYGTITNCYSTGSVVGEGAVGGLVGEIYDPGTITNCYSTASVSGDEEVGGLLGYNIEGEVTFSFWDIETSGQEYSDGGTGLTTAEMQTMSAFTEAGWDFVGESVNGTEDIWWIFKGDYPHLWWEGIHVSMKLTPRTLNCRSYGNWVKAHLTLPQGFTVADVDPDRPAVLHSFGFESAHLYVSVNKDKRVQIEAAFERQAVCSLAGNWPEALTVAGFLADGNVFLGTSTVKIIHPGMKVIEELASCWLQGDCVHPTWCGGIDMNRDSLVNLLDYALLMNINVEFITDE